VAQLLKKRLAVGVFVAASLVLSLAACDFSSIPGFSQGQPKSKPAPASERLKEPATTLDDTSNGGSNGDSSHTASGASAAPAAATAKPMLVVKTGTRLSVRMETALGSDTSRSGDPVIGKLTSPVVDGDHVVLPEGSELRGRVTRAIISGKTKGRGELGFKFEKIVVKGREYDLASGGVDMLAKSGKGKDAKMIGGGAAAGTIIGAIAGGRKGALIGAGVGAGAGTGASLATRGPQARVAVGSTVVVKTTRELEVEG
jgi:hypothetical protein